MPYDAETIDHFMTSFILVFADPSFETEVMLDGADDYHCGFAVETDHVPAEPDVGIPLAYEEVSVCEMRWLTFCSTDLTISRAQAVVHFGRDAIEKAEREAANWWQAKINE